MQDKEKLEGFFKGADPEKAAQVMVSFIDTFLKESGLDDDPIVQGLKDGNTAAQTLGLGREDLEVLYAMGFNALNNGEPQKAYDTFFQLTMIDPLEAKNYYCVGVSLQMMGEHARAAEMFVNFLGLDATNPDGYLRYGECLLALGETGEAREAFALAEAEAAKGNGDTAALEEAQAKLAMMQEETNQ